jgi:hypothetical protein
MIGPYFLDIHFNNILQASSYYYSKQPLSKKLIHQILYGYIVTCIPVAAGQVAERSKAWTVFVRLDAVIVGSNSASGMDVWCVRLFCVCVVLCVDRGLATGWSPVQGVLSTVYIPRNWSKTSVSRMLYVPEGATTKIPIGRQRVGKQIPATQALNNRKTSTLGNGQVDACSGQQMMVFSMGSVHNNYKKCCSVTVVIQLLLSQSLPSNGPTCHNTIPILSLPRLLT